MFFTTTGNGRPLRFPTFAEAADCAAVHANTRRSVHVCNGNGIPFAAFWRLEDGGAVWSQAVALEGKPLLEEWALSRE